MRSRFTILTGLAGLILTASAATAIGCSTDSASAAGDSSGATNVVVLCSSCGIPGKEHTPHLILLDQVSGEVWAYAELDQQPTPLGRLTRLGTPIQK